jgi:hypothetical protein
MNADERLEEWIRSRRLDAAPPGFAERVVRAGIRHRRLVAALAFAGASAVAALRIAAAFAPFVAQ